MKRRQFVALALASIGLFGGGSVCSPLRAQSVSWNQRFPDIVPAPSMAEYSVGVTANTTNIFSGGMSFQSTTLPPSTVGIQQFAVAQFDFGTGTVLHEGFWPPHGRLANVSRTVTDMVALSSGDSTQVWLTGYSPDVSGRWKQAIVDFGCTPNKVAVNWGRVEDSDLSTTNDYSIGLSVGVDPNGNPTRAAIVGQSVPSTNDSASVLARIYDAGNGATVKKITWHSTAGSTDTPVGISVIGAGTDDIVVIAGTTNRVTGSNQTYDRLFVLAFKGPTWDPLPGSPIIVDGGGAEGAYALTAAASATAKSEVAGTTSLTAVAATRTWTSGVLTGKKEIVTLVYTLDWSNGSTPTLTAAWGNGESWYGGPPGRADLTVPTCVTVAGFPGTDVATPFHVFVGGTAQQTSTSAKEMVLLQYGNTTNPSDRLGWWERWSRQLTPPHVGDNIPAQIRYSEYTVDGDHYRRIYVTGKSQNDAYDFDMETVKYDAPATTPRGGQGIQVWNVAWPGPAGNDAGISVFPAPGMQSAGLGFFITGPSYSATTSDDWVTVRYSDPNP